MSHREESQTALLVAAEVLLRAADYPACRGLPAVLVPTALLGQLAEAAASVVGSEADVPIAGPERASAALAAHFTPVDTDRPGFCQGDADCWRQPDLPGGLCHYHSPIAQKPYPWQQMQMRAGVFAVPEDDHEPD